MPPQEPNEVNRGILQVLLLDIHRTSIQAQPATGTSIDLGLRHTFPRMVRLDSGIAKQYPKHLRKDVHVAAERHCGEEQAQADGIQPPARHYPQLVTEYKMPQVVDRNGQEASAAEVGGETLGEKPQREYQPEAVQSHAVRERRLGGMLHAQGKGTEALEHGQSDTRKHIEQEEVHQEEEHPAPQRSMARIHPDEEPVEDWIEQGSLGNSQPLRDEQSYFYMSEYDQHEPSESDCAVHISQQRLPLPDLDMEKAVEEQIPDVLQCRNRIHEGCPEPQPVVMRNLQQQPDAADRNPYQEECYADAERYDEMVVPGRDPVDDFRRSLGNLGSLGGEDIGQGCHNFP